MIQTAKLTVEPGLSNPDEFYEALLRMHCDLSQEQSELANAKLILLLANHIGDETVLGEALAVARDGIV